MILRPDDPAGHLVKFGHADAGPLQGADQLFVVSAADDVRTIAELWSKVSILGVRARRGVGVGGSRKTKRHGWPPSGAYRDFLEYLDRLREDNGRPTYAELANKLHLAKSRVSEFLTNAEEIPEDHVKGIVLAMGEGAGPDEVAEACRLRIEARGARRRRNDPPVLPPQSIEVTAGSAGLESLFDGVSRERGAELLAELTARDVAGLLNSVEPWRIADMVSAMPVGKAVRLLQDLERSRRVELLMLIPSDKAAPLVAALGAELVVELAGTERVRKVASILEQMDRKLVARWLVKELSARAATLLSEFHSHTAARTISEMDIESRNRVLRTISVEALGRMFDQLDSGVQVLLLSNLLDRSVAAAVLTFSRGEGFTGKLKSLPVAILAEIIDIADSSEGVLWLACVPTRKSVLRALPEDRARYFRAQLEPDQLAGHLRNLNEYRAAEYLEELDSSPIPADELLAAMDPEESSRIVLSIGDFRGIARWLNRLPMTHVTELLESNPPWEAAAILDHLDREFVAAVLSNLAQAPRGRILKEIGERVTFRAVEHRELSDAEFEELCNVRRAALSELKKKLGAA